MYGLILRKTIMTMWNASFRTTTKMTTFSLTCNIHEISFPVDIIKRIYLKRMNKYSDSAMTNCITNLWKNFWQLHYRVCRVHNKWRIHVKLYEQLYQVDIIYIYIQLLLKRQNIIHKRISIYYTGTNELLFDTGWVADA